MKNYLKEAYSIMMYRFRVAQAIYVVITCIIMITMASIEKVSIWLGTWGVGVHGLTLYISLFISTGLFFYIIGYTYEKWKIWRTEIRVTNERNPYFWYKFSPRERSDIFGKYVPIMEMLNELLDHKHDKDVERIKKWGIEGEAVFDIDDFPMDDYIKEKIKKISKGDETV